MAQRHVRSVTRDFASEGTCHRQRPVKGATRFITESDIAILAEPGASASQPMAIYDRETRKRAEVNTSEDR
jgi:hypothetical protein